MQKLVLVAQMDSPFVRRVAITMTVHGHAHIAIVCALL
jgi:hypothetical protein